MRKIKNPLEDYQVVQLSDKSLYIANVDTIGVEETKTYQKKVKVYEMDGVPIMRSGEGLNSIPRDDKDVYAIYNKSDVYYYPECPGTEGGGSKIVDYQVGNVSYDSLLPATATGITITWEYTATTQNPDGTTTTTTGTTSKVVPITPNTGDDDKIISGTIKIDGTDVEIPYEVIQKNKHCQEITSYEVIKNISKPIYVPATATSVTLEWEYIMTYVDENGDTHTETGTESKTIEIEPNTSNEDKTINGVITICDTEIPYEIVQKGKNYKDVTNYEVSNITYPDNIGNDDTEFTVTWDYTMTYIDENGETHTETGTDSATIEVGPNETGEERYISGKIDMFGTIIEYEVVQKDKDYKNEYLTFIALEDAEFWFEQNDGVGELYYSLDNGKTWTEIPTFVEEHTTLIHNGEKIMWKGSLLYPEYSHIGQFYSTGKFNIEGNILSVSYEDFYNEKPLEINHFSNFFKETKVVSAENLYLQPTNLTDYCYASLFESCEFLTLPPKLLATTLEPSCYSYMFSKCNSLTSDNLPELPATTLSERCYYGMFDECTSLTEVPKDYLLNATNIVGDGDGCYDCMFKGCTSLTNVPDLPKGLFETVPSLMFQQMFAECTSLTEVPKDYLPWLDVSSIAPYAYMFSECTSLKNAHDLPATKIGNSCYKDMFFKCTSLTESPELPATTLNEECYPGMFAGCTSLTKAPILPAATLAKDSYAYMFSGCTSLNYIKCLATNINATRCTSNWVLNVAPSGTFIKAQGMSNWTIGANGIPTGWTIEPDDDIVPDDNYLITKYYSDGDNPTIIYNFYLSTVENIIYNGTDIKPQTTGTSVTCRGCYTFNESGEILLKIKIHENEEESIYADLTETDIVKCTVKEGIKSLRGSFGSCKNLKLVVLPDSIESIESAFWGCNNLETVDLSRVVTPPTIDENAFDSVENDDFKIIVPEESINEYKTAQYWSKYADKIVSA